MFLSLKNPGRNAMHMSTNHPVPSAARLRGALRALVAGWFGAALAIALTSESAPAQSGGRPPTPPPRRVPAPAPRPATKPADSAKTAVVPTPAPVAPAVPFATVTGTLYDS